MTRWIVCALLALGLAFAAAAATPVAEHVLGGGVLARVDTEGAVIVGVAPGGAFIPVLNCAWPEPAARRPGEPVPAFTAAVREGDPGGHRGFSRDADDDADGRTDEDRLDGRDNDGDGAIDEDYAAISHDMAVWNREFEGGVRHLETYHWTYRHLAGLVVAIFRQEPGGTIEPLRLQLAEPAVWVQADEFCQRTAGLGSGPMFVASLPDPRAAERVLWLGAALLDARPRQRADERVRAESRLLTVPVSAGEQVVVLAAGPTRLQVMGDLTDALRLRAGAVDPVSGMRVPWLPPAIPAVIPADVLPVASLRPEADGGCSLVFAVGPEQLADFDPDLFRCGDRPLGPAAGLRWTDADGRTRFLPWPVMTGAGEDACHPYHALGVSAGGQLEIHFPAGADLCGDTLDAVFADGRRATLPLAVLAAPESNTASAGAAAAADLDDASNEPHLSPELLSNYPNPFRSSTRVSFRVPATVGEAFAWADGIPPTVDPQARLPFAGGSASVTVTVYGLEGQEVATLFTGSVGVGAYEAQWDGRDRQGRTMASGAYFCKLQIAKWSVTKRLIFIR